MDIYQYRDDLIAKLAQVEGVISGMGGKTPKVAKGKQGGKRKKRKPLSAAVRAKMAASRRDWWAKKKSGKK